jgi:hypothetical protein
MAFRDEFQLLLRRHGVKFMVRAILGVLLCPFRAARVHDTSTQGGAVRLRRGALPWADMSLTLRAEKHVPLAVYSVLGIFLGTSN